MNLKILHLDPKCLIVLFGNNLLKCKGLLFIQTTCSCKPSNKVAFWSFSFVQEWGVYSYIPLALHSKLYFSFGFAAPAGGVGYYKGWSSEF